MGEGRPFIPMEPVQRGKGVKCIEATVVRGFGRSSEKTRSKFLGFQKRKRRGKKKDAAQSREWGESYRKARKGG